MITLSMRLPKHIYLAISGGVDSVAALDFLVKKHKVSLLHVNHSEGNSNVSEHFVSELAAKYGCNMYSYYINTPKPKALSLEEFWRIERYKFFHSFDEPVVTAHTLDDCVETWLWSSMHGQGKVIPTYNRNVVRPFLLTRKKEFISWAAKYNISWIEDESNNDMGLTRNYIRHMLMPHALKVNPGLYKTILKKVKSNVK